MCRGRGEGAGGWRRREIGPSQLKAQPVLEAEVGAKRRWVGRRSAAPEAGWLRRAGEREGDIHLCRVACCSPWSGCGVPGTQGPQEPRQSTRALGSGRPHYTGRSRRTRRPTDPRHPALGGRDREAVRNLNLTLDKRVYAWRPPQAGRRLVSSVQKASVNITSTLPAPFPLQDMPFSAYPC